VFADLRGFTRSPIRAEPEEVESVLREFHATMGALVVEYEGTLDRFAGDGILIFFKRPAAVSRPPGVRDADGARNAAALLRLARRWSKLGYELDLGIGIAQGYATLGAFGYEGRVDYTAIGSVVNLAARLCDRGRPRRSADRSQDARVARDTAKGRRSRTDSARRIRGAASRCSVSPRSDDAGGGSVHHSGSASGVIAT
jgi:class 3 adenylate cyclase